MSATRKVHNATEGKGKGDNEIGYQGEGKRMMTTVTMIDETR
jgi:hypothetical protein